MKFKYSKHNIQSLRKMICQFFYHLNLKIFSYLKAKNNSNYTILIIRYHIKESWMKRKDTKCQINLKITIIKIKTKNKKQKSQQ